MLAVQSVVRPLIRGYASRGVRQSRSIHLPPLSRVVGRSSGLVNRFQTFLHQAIRNLSQLQHAVVQTGPRLAPRVTIGSSLSPVARHILSRPMTMSGIPSMPRPLHVARQLNQVGLGAARTFATSRPIFANLVENVPVVARALIEADFDLKVSPALRLRVHRSKENKPVKAKSKSTLARTKYVSAQEVEEDKIDVEALAQYFKVVPEATVVSFLDIPLAPTPTGRMPLAERPLSGPPLAPLRQLAQTHATRNKHAIRVASLFRRLDGAKVWEKGATMEAFGDRSGLCTVLRVKFSGWTEDEVRAVIGEGGKGWCTLMETRPEVASPWADVDSVFNDHLSSRSLSPLPWADLRLGNSSTEFSAANDSFIMPTMELSASFISRASTAEPVQVSTPPTPASAYHSDFDDHFSSYPSTDAEFADVESLSDEADSAASAWAAESVQSLRSTLSFSSSHWRRVSTVVNDF